MLLNVLLGRRDCCLLCPGILPSCKPIPRGLTAAPAAGAALQTQLMRSWSRLAAAEAMAALHSIPSMRRRQHEQQRCALAALVAARLCPLKHSSRHAHLQFVVHVPNPNVWLLLQQQSAPCDNAFVCTAGYTQMRAY